MDEYVATGGNTSITFHDYSIFQDLDMDGCAWNDQSLPDIFLEGNLSDLYSMYGFDNLTAPLPHHRSC